MAGMEQIIMFGGIALGAAGVLWAAMPLLKPKPKQQKKVDLTLTPVALEQAVEGARLAGIGPFIVRTAREAASESHTCETAAAAMAQAVAAFRQDKTKQVLVTANTENLLSLRRAGSAASTPQTTQGVDIRRFGSA